MRTSNPGSGHRRPTSDAGDPTDQPAASETGPAAGYCLDRYFAPRVATFFYACLLVGIGLFLTGSGTQAGLAAAFFIGLGLGAEADIIPYLISRYFGLRAFAPIVSVAFSMFVLAGALGPLLMGAGFDRSGSYRGVLLLLFLTTLLALILVVQLGPYRFCARLDGRSA